MAEAREKELEQVKTAYMDGMACTSEIEKIVFKRKPSPADTAAIVVESIQGEGGFIVPSPEFHQELRRICDENNVLLIADEVQSDSFRIEKFMAMENFGVKADIVRMSKSIGGGIPPGATLSSGKIMSWPPGAHANTLGGNPSCCSGRAGDAGIQGEQWARRESCGEGQISHLKRLKELQEKFDIIGMCGE